MKSKDVLWFASTNVDKIKEIKSLFATINYEIKSLLDLPTPIDILETGKTYEENALIKAIALAKIVNQPVFADDSGLEISALNNFPGINSNRWRKEMSYYEAMQVIINMLINKVNRSATMITAIAYVNLENNVERIFTGKLVGEISQSVANKAGGFGYDQIFYVPKFKKTLFEMGKEQKNKISHRYLAIQKLILFLSRNN